MYIESIKKASEGFVSATVEIMVEEACAASA